MMGGPRCVVKVFIIGQVENFFLCDLFPSIIKSQPKELCIPRLPSMMRRWGNRRGTVVSGKMEGEEGKCGIFFKLSPTLNPVSG